MSNAILVSLEGVLLGAATTFAQGIPLAQLAIPALVVADVSASMTFLSRHVCQVAASYGYSSFDLVNLPDILAAMAPTSSSSDEGFLAVKSLAVAEIRNASNFASKHVGDLLDDMAVPSLVNLIRAVAQKIGVTITEKELGLLVPVAGAVLNGGLNLAFQQTNHTSAKDYFRKLYLINKYGEDNVVNAIQIERKRLQGKVSAG